MATKLKITKTTMNGVRVQIVELKGLKMKYENREAERKDLVCDLNNLMLGMIASGKSVDTDTDLEIVTHALKFIKEGGDSNGRH